MYLFKLNVDSYLWWK